MELELDTLFRVPNDLIYNHINLVIPQRSVDVIIFRPCLDVYLIKKTMWNALTRLKDYGVMLVECVPENVGIVINALDTTTYNYKVSAFASKDMLALYVLIYKYYSPNNKFLKSYRIITWEEDIPTVLMNIDTFGKNVLLLGDRTLPYIPALKNMSKYIVAMGGDQMYIQLAKSQGIRIVDIL